VDRPGDPGPTGGERALNAEHADQLRLLDVQALDSRIDQLAHRRRTLPQLAAIDQVVAGTTQVRDLLVAAETEQSDIEREVAKAETDVEAVRARAVRDRERMDAGQVGSAKELEALQHELGSLAKRQSDLEEVELEAMERLESVQSRLAELRERAEALAAQLEVLEQQRDGAFTDIDKDTAYLAGERAKIGEGLPGDLVALYEKLRAGNGGVGAAALQGARCMGCRLELTPTELGRIRNASPDEVQRCEECRRILVRPGD
jgi:predicted  nucleic acid-binding Zn-ribbon protein